MRERIAELAKQNNRSMNSEIVARLEQSLDDQADLSIFTKFINLISERDDGVFEDTLRKLRNKPAPHVEQVKPFTPPNPDDDDAPPPPKPRAPRKPKDS